MKPSTLPVICGVALTACSAAGLSHWWSVREFTLAVDAGLPVSIPVTAHPVLAQYQDPATGKPSRLLTPKPSSPVSTPVISTTPDSHQKEFFEQLVAKMQSLQNQNRDLLDQVAETNRDLMKLEFRVDTHSESFRPLPVTEDRPFTRLESEPGLGVLPPRAEPVTLPDNP